VDDDYGIGDDVTHQLGHLYETKGIPTVRSSSSSSSSRRRRRRRRREEGMEDMGTVLAAE